jgi:hypothetical protein
MVDGDKNSIVRITGIGMQLKYFFMNSLQSAVSQHAERASHQMKLYLWEPADGDSEHITGGFSYRSDMYAEATMTNILQRYLLICEEVCSFSSLAPSHLMF